MVIMWSLFHLQQKLIPELFETMRKRLDILQKIELYQPVGRRSLARMLNQTERILRAEVESLKDQGLIDIQPNGMSLTQEGKQIIHRLYPFMLSLNGLNEMEERLAHALRIKKAYIVMGDAKQDPQVKNEIGRVAAHYLINNKIEHDRIAVTGGSTLAAMAAMMYSEQSHPDLMLLPARGGLGELVDTQANSIAAQLAMKLGGNYLLLQVPDHLSEEAYQSLIEEPYIHERVKQIRSARMIFHGIGNAVTMAKQRGASDEVLNLLFERKAVSEAFGAYFDEDGKLVYQMPTIGLRLEDLTDKICIALAGGSNKATAIRSLAKTGLFQVLITDEGAAKEILR